MLLALLALFGIAACESGSPFGAGGTARVELEAADVNVVGTTESLAYVLDVQPRSEDEIWVFNSIEPYFVAFSADGSVLRQWGRAGEGPGELRDPVVLVQGTVDGEVWAFDRGRHVLLEVSGKEDVPREIWLPSDSVPRRLAGFDEAGVSSDRVRLEVVDGGVVAGLRAAELGGALALWGIELVEIGLPEGGVRSVFDFTSVLGDPTALHDPSMMFLPYPIWSVCSDGEILLYDPQAHLLRRRGMADEEGVAPQDGDGMGAADLTLPAKRELEINFDRIFRMLYSDLLEQSRRGRAEMPADSATLHADFRREWLEVESQVAGVFPEYADLRCGPGGEAWLQPFDPDEGVMGKGPDWLRITPNGERTEVQMPPNFVPYRFHEDRIWGMVRGEFDVPSVGWVATPG